MKSLWLDIGNTRLKYWITENQQIIEHAAELHLQSPADLLLGLIQHFKHQGLHRIGISSVLDTENNQRIQQILKWLEIPVVFAKVHSEYAGLQCGYEVPSQLGIDRWLQVLAVAEEQENYCIIGCGTALTIDLTQGKQHLGGYILPNLYLQRDALIQNTKGIKIPDSAFDNLNPGNNTVDAVHHGILLGLISTIENIMQQSPKKLLLLTGGDASLFAKFLQKYQPTVETDLLLKGLQQYIAHYPKD